MNSEITMPKVSVRLMTYMHVNYISEAIEGCLMQKTNFPFEIVIGDDFSTDGTAEICSEYQKKYPDVIKLLDRPVNGEYWIKRQKLGRLHNFVDILNNCRGNYIAILDGDDYWTDPLKLQKQFDILEQNKDIIVCHHWQTYCVKNGLEWQVIEAPTLGHGYLNQPNGTVKDIFENKLRIKTRSMMFRNIIDNKFFPEWFFEVPFGDVPLNFLLGKHGNFYFINEPMAVYRQTETGISTAGRDGLGLQNFKVKHFRNWIKIWDLADRFYAYEYHSEVSKSVDTFNMVCIKNLPYSLASMWNMLSFNLFERPMSLQKSYYNCTHIISFYLRNSIFKLRKKIKMA